MCLIIECISYDHILYDIQLSKRMDNIQQWMCCQRKETLGLNETKFEISIFNFEVNPSKCIATEDPKRNNR